MNDSVVLAALKALSIESKSLLMASELSARRLPSFQLRTIFNALIKDDDERRIIVDQIDKDLQSHGIPEDQVFALLNDLLSVPSVMQMNEGMQSTRRLRSPFTQGFESQMPAQIGTGLGPPPNGNGNGIGAPMIGAVQYNPRQSYPPSGNYPAASSEHQRPDNSQFAKRPGPPSGADNNPYSQPQRTGSYPISPPQGFPPRGSSVRDTQSFSMPQNQRTSPSPIPLSQSIDPRGGPAPASSSQRYSQNAFHNPNDLPNPLPAKPQGFSANSYGPPEPTASTSAPGLPGLPGMPPITVRPQPAQPGNPSLTQQNRRFGNEQRLSPSEAAMAVSEAALLTPGLANVSAPLASKIVSRTDGSPNNFQGGTSANVRSNDGRPTVLIADDDKRIRMVFRLRMEESGMTVVECADGTEAWDRIQQGDITLAVLDMKMPGLHGLEVLSRMADKQFRIPVIVCSAYDQLKDEFVVQTYPRLRYLVKPVAPEQLVGSIKELLVKQSA